MSDRRLRRAWALATIAALGAAVGASGQTNMPALAPSPAAIPSPPGIPPGFKPLFNGRNLTGWHWSRTNHHGTVAKVEARNGEIQLSQQPYGQGGLLLTDKIYKNFDLYLEVQVPFASNSGVFLRSTESGSAYQIELVNGGASGQLLGENLKLSVGIPASRDMASLWRVDDFNSIRVRMEGDAPHVTVWVNGVQTGETQEPRNDKIAGETTGHIGLQLHWMETYEPAISGGAMSNSWKPGEAIRFRNIAIKELP
ncbi:MAG: hypothetical protein JWM33_3158 [Caulobacteraceae bacterium]|nr:hypothetical protein [Caulobacteraceae bacterium]